MMPNLPLIELADGADQDDRTALLAAYRRVQSSHRRREVSDLHVRELLTYVLRFDTRGDGVQMSYDDIANLLCCERSTARSVVRRAEEVYGLLATFESRYVRGGQAPNRYSIDWQAVRAINGNATAEHSVTPTHSETGRAIADENAEPAPQEAGDTRMHPPATRAQGAVTTPQPPVTRRHPYKEYTLPSSLCLSAAAAEAAAELRAWEKDRWDEVCRRASGLAKVLARKSDRPPKEFIWQVVVAAELLDRGMSADWITRLAAGDIKSPRRYLDAAMRQECERRGLDWLELRKAIPDAGKQRFGSTIEPNCSVSPE